MPEPDSPTSATVRPRGTLNDTQFGVSLLIDSRYEPHHLGRYYNWMIWYPMIYWAIQVAASVVSVPKAFFKKSGERAVWVSPDRGIKPGSEA